MGAWVDGWMDGWKKGRIDVKNLLYLDAESKTSSGTSKNHLINCFMANKADNKF